MRFRRRGGRAKQTHVVASPFIGRVDSFDNDEVGGWIADPNDPTKTFDVKLSVDGVDAGRVRAQFPRPDVKEAGYGMGANGFFFRLPPAVKAHSTSVVVREAETSIPLQQPVTFRREPTLTFGGLSAAEACEMISKPLVWIGFDAIEFRSNTVVLRGNYLPPKGDPHAYEVLADEGVAFSITRYLPDFIPNEDLGSWRDITGSHYFWFWPNVRWSRWKIEVDLRATTNPSQYFNFEFRPFGSTTAHDRDRMVVPKDLRLWQRVPPNEFLWRVQLGDYPEASPIRAASNCRAILDMAQDHGFPSDGGRVLDWGCGWGRVARVLLHMQSPSELWGADVDATAITWATANIQSARFTTLPLFPPTDLPENYFDLLYSISVMTHLTRDAQDQWIAEIERVLRPGGLAVLTFHGRTALAFSSRYLNDDVLSNVRTHGFDAATESRDLEGIIDDDYYRLTYQTPDWVTANWGARLEVVEIREAVVGLQDAVTLRKRS